MLISLGQSWFSIPVDTTAETGASTTVMAMAIAQDVLAGVAYFGLFEGLWGRSFGKICCRIRVTSGTGERVGFATATKRAAVSWAVPNGVSDLVGVVLPTKVAVPGAVLVFGISPASILVLVGIAAVLFSPARRANGYQTLHDRWTATSVVRDPRIAVAMPYIGLGRFAVWLGWASLFAPIGVILVPLLFPSHRWPYASDLQLRNWSGWFIGISLLGGFLSLLAGLVTWRKAAMALGASAIVAGGVIAPGFVPRLVAYEAQAIGSLRSINSSESTYSSSCGGNGYAQTLEDLAKPPEGSTSGFISPDLAKNGVIKVGYVVTLGPNAGAVTVTPASKTCNGARADAVSSYFAEAHPVRVGTTGQRSFATDERGTIYFNNTGAVIPPGMAGASVLQ